MTLDKLREKLRAVGDVRNFASQAGLSHMTIYRVRDGHVAPNMRTFEKLVAAVRRRRIPG